MRRLEDITRTEGSMGTLVELTSAFEGIASMRIAEIKDQVLQSAEFFEELWQIYSQLRIGGFSFGRGKSGHSVNKDLYIIITSEGSLSGDIDQKLVRLMLKSYDKNNNEIIVVGRHGANQLSQLGVDYKKYFRMPQKDRDINVTPLIREIQQYRSTRLFYQEYVSLTVQNVKSIELANAVKERGNASDRPDEIISEKTYIFEPSAYEVAAHLERSMMQIAISQLILDSKLAQYASRFRAMSASRERATQMKQDLRVEYNRVKRGLKDERLKEIMNGLKQTQAGAGA